jgi:N-acetylglucosaminyl-diphospho-decaprenol L-rhamnosyltransferase
MKDYSIVISTFYPGDIIKKCLEHLPDDQEILIIDNGNDEKLRDNLSKIRKKIFYHNIGDVGISKSLNYAVSKCSNNYIFITQPDVVITTDSIIKLIEAAEKYENTGILSPITSDNGKYSRFDHYELKISNKGKVLDNKKNNFSLLEPEGDICVEAVNSTALLVKKDIIEKIGKWDDNIYTYLEDIDICVRLRLKGYQILKIPAAKAHHIGFASHEKKNHNQHELLRNWHFCWSSIYFKKKHCEKKEFFLFFTNLFIKSLLKTFVNLVLFRINKFKINFIKLRACISFLFIKKSNFRRIINN